MGEKLTAAATWIFLRASALFFGGLLLLIPIMLLAYVMPAWWQYVFAAVAIPTLAALPIWLIAGAVGLAIKPGAQQ